MSWLHTVRQFIRSALSPKAAESSTAAVFDRLTRDSLHAALCSKGLEPFAQQLARAARPSVGFETVGSEVAIGHSKLGGQPDLPPETPWPIRPALRSIYPNAPADVRGYIETPQPLTFIAQINFALLPEGAARNLGVPERGMLLLFYDLQYEGWGFRPDDANGFAVLFIEDTRILARATAPIAGPLFTVCGELGLSGFERLTPIPTEGICFDALQIPEGARDLYSATLEDLGLYGDIHRLGGWPTTVQNPMEEECALVTAGIDCGDNAGWTSEAAQIIRAQPNDWQLLLQIGYEEDIGMTWADVGTIYLWIRNADLQAQRFDRCWLILQSC